MYGCLLDLLSAEHPVLAPFLSALLSVFARVLPNDEVAPEVRNRIGGEIQRLRERRAEHWGGIVSHLPREEVAVLEAAVGR